MIYDDDVATIDNNITHANRGDVFCFVDKCWPERRVKVLSLAIPNNNNNSDSE